MAAARNSPPSRQPRTEDFAELRELEHRFRSCSVPPPPPKTFAALDWNVLLRLGARGARFDLRPVQTSCTVPSCSARVSAPAGPSGHAYAIGREKFTAAWPSRDLRLACWRTCGRGTAAEKRARYVDAAKHGARSTIEELNAVAEYEGERRKHNRSERRRGGEMGGEGREEGRTAEKMGSLGPWDITVPRRRDAGALSPPRRCYLSHTRERAVPQTHRFQRPLPLSALRAAIWRINLPDLLPGQKSNGVRAEGGRTGAAVGRMKRRETGTKREIEVWRGQRHHIGQCFQYKRGNNETAFGNYCRYLFAPGDFQSNQYSAAAYMYAYVHTMIQASVVWTLLCLMRRAGNGGPEFRECTGTVKVNASCLYHVGLFQYKWPGNFNYSSNDEISSAWLLAEVVQI